MSKADRRQKHTAYMRKYRQKRRELAAHGDVQAQRQLKKESNRGSYRTAKSFIKRKANKEQLITLNGLISDRFKKL